MITRAIKIHPFKYVPKNENNASSSKSIRITFIIKMADHQGVYSFDIHYLSDHSLGTNQERYLDQNILELTLSGA